MDGRGCLAFLALGTLVLLTVFFVHRTYSYAICSEVEREAIASLPPYGRDPVSPKPNLEVGSCQINYYAQSDREDVASYYRDELRERGWVRPDSDRIAIEGQGEIQLPYRKFYPYGVKDNVLYEVSTESYGSSETFVYIHVSSLGD